MKEELAKETINFDTKTKAYTNLSQKCKFQKQSSVDFKLGVLKIFVNSKGKHLSWSLFLNTDVFLLTLQNF